MINLISIGSNCKTRYQINLFLLKLYPERSVGAYFFDSLMGGGVEGATNIINRDFTLRPEDIFIVERDGKFIPGDKSSGFRFLHDFGTKDEYWSSQADCESALAEAFDNSMAKYAYLGKKTANFLASGEDICLVYYGPAGAGDFGNLQRVLRYKFGRDFTIINVLNGAWRAVTKNGSIITVFVDDDNSPKLGTAREWEGWDESWEAALSAIFSPKDIISVGAV